MTRMQVSMLPDGRRLHLQDGPIDLIIGAEGEAEHVTRAYDVAQIRFSTVLDELCEELPLLRQPTDRLPQGAVASRMWRATADLAKNNFITPMAAVAGSVAEEVLYAMLTVSTLERAHVNNGGDIALYLAAGQTYRLAVASPDATPKGQVQIADTDPVRGIATSGQGGRSFSFGIADSVTVLAATAAQADVAATLIANAVDLPGHPKIIRRPANSLQHDTDLGDRLVVTQVGRLTTDETEAALIRGEAIAQTMRAAGHIHAAALFLNGQSRLVGATTALDLIPQRILTHA